MQQAMAAVVLHPATDQLQGADRIGGEEVGKGGIELAIHIGRRGAMRQHLKNVRHNQENL